jgi:hypothetical protein
MPAEQLATSDQQSRSPPIAVSHTTDRSSSPNASATPRAAAPRDSPHRLERVAGRDGVARRFGAGDPLGREQRTFHLDIVRVGRTRDLSLGHGPADGIGHGLDLGAAADLPGLHRRCAGTTDG